MSHQCPRRGCTRTVSTGKLFCPDDWKLVPEPVQKALYRAYGRHGEGRGTPAHRAAMAVAIRAVNGTGGDGDA